MNFSDYLTRALEKRVLKLIGDKTIPNEGVQNNNKTPTVNINQNTTNEDDLMEFDDSTTNTADNASSTKENIPTKEFNVKEVAIAVNQATKDWGTDEEALKDALIGLTKEQIEEVDAYYQEHYGKSLAKLIKDETSKTLRKTLMSALEGNTAPRENFNSDEVATQIYKATKGSR